LDPETANPGLARPPLVYLVAIVVAWLLGFIWPQAFVPHDVRMPLGVAIILGAVVLFILSTGRLRAAGTPVPGNRPTTAIVRSGPYRFSRNPIYLAFSLLQLGIALWTGNSWQLVSLVAVTTFMTLVVIRREERYLEAKFGGEYLDYKASVRRWI
jgi:protein-S-isoprenylcysteine O-methyltransferase Ste14